MIMHFHFFHCKDFSTEKTLRKLDTKDCFKPKNLYLASQLLPIIFTINFTFWIHLAAQSNCS